MNKERVEVQYHILHTFSPGESSGWSAESKFGVPPLGGPEDDPKARTPNWSTTLEL